MNKEKEQINNQTGYLAITRYCGEIDNRSFFIKGQECHLLIVI